MLAACCVGHIPRGSFSTALYPTSTSQLAGPGNNGRPRLAASRLRALEAAGGATDFGGLCIGFSLFLIAAAALLTAQLFRLGVERRAGESGVMQALGYPVAVVRRRLLAEGLVVALGGGLVGPAGGRAGSPRPSPQLRQLRHLASPPRPVRAGSIQGTSPR